VALFHEEGAEAWHKYSVEELLPAGTTCAHCGNKQRVAHSTQPHRVEWGTTEVQGSESAGVAHSSQRHREEWETTEARPTESNAPALFRKEMDILDVWFDSGVSWNAVLIGNPEQQFPASLYIEGADQHRGWFHSSLLCSVAIKETAPYKKVATVGWTLDEQGRALSKSLGNGVDPVDIANRLGAEVVRLWAASVDFREDVAASENLMQRAAENYKKLRNTFKFLLGNLNGFDPVKDAVKDEELLPLDRYMLARTRELTEKVLAWYDEFEFHRVYHAVNEFTIVDLSALYLDVLKDRMYTFAPVSIERRSAQTVIWKITEALVRLVAPILTFTAEEVWSYLPQVAGREPSVHLALFTKPEISPNEEKLLEDWKQLLFIRESVLKNIEERRKEKQIGKALEAKVSIKLVGTSPNLRVLENYEDSLKELFNVSQVTLSTVHVQRESSNEFSVYEGPDEGLDLYVIGTADGTKCERCWNYYADDGPNHVRQFGPWSNVCGRCANTLRQMPEFAPFENAGSVNA
jgi:isoleucyl-tRNA synthetase